MRVFHGATAPSSIERDSSGTSVDSSTSRTVPRPPQVGQAPPELNAMSSAPGPMKVAPQVGHVISRSSDTAVVGGTWWPFGQTWLPQRE